MYLIIHIDHINIDIIICCTCNNHTDISMVNPASLKYMYLQVCIYIYMYIYKYIEVDWFRLCCPTSCKVLWSPQAAAPGRKLVATGDCGGCWRYDIWSPHGGRYLRGGWVKGRRVKKWSYFTSSTVAPIYFGYATPTGTVVTSPFSVIDLWT